MTLTLPDHRLAVLTTFIKQLLTQRHTSCRNLRQLLGVLCSSTLALNVLAHLFSILQHALVSSCQCHVCLTQLKKAVLADIHLLINNHRIHAATATDHDLLCVNFMALEFTNQKNAICGELMGLGCSGHSTWCPIYSIDGSK